MLRRLGRRLVRLVLRLSVAVAVVAGVLALVAGVARRRAAPPPAPAAPSWPPLDPATAVALVEAESTTESVDVVAAPAPTWVAPVDGAAPESHPVKANVRSGIYHVPGGRSYARTVPDRCYASAADAETDGFRAAKA